MERVAEYRYTPVRQIDAGEGKNSIGVWEAIESRFGRTVAVKEIDKGSFPDPAACYDEAERMFKAGHPNVVPIITLTERSDTICLSMPYFKNGSLASRIARGNLFTSEVLLIGRQILAGVGAIHSANTVHFDIKPSNILFSDEGVAMIADFGQAREADSLGVALMPNRMYGAVIPPEAFTNNRRGTPQSDLFQVGLTLWRACNGKEMYDAEVKRAQSMDFKDAVVGGRFPRRDLFLPHVPDRLRRAIRTALQVTPGDRHDSAHEFSNKLINVDTEYDWCPQSFANGNLKFAGRKPGAANMVLNMAQNAGTWDVSLFTTSNGKDRKARGDKWRDGLSRIDALRHCREVIDELH